MIFPESAQKECNQEHLINLLAVVVVLIQKGLVTHAELAKARLVATHFVDQEFASSDVSSASEKEQL